MISVDKIYEELKQIMKVARTCEVQKMLGHISQEKCNYDEWVTIRQSMKRIFECETSEECECALCIE